MKYVRVGNLDHIPEERSWEYDDYGNRIDKVTGDFVVLVPKIIENTHEPMVLVNVNGEWIPKQMEFDF